MFGLLNKLFVWLQRLVQGIPGGSAHLYDKVATRYLEPSYGYVLGELGFRDLSGLVVLEVGCGVGRLLLDVAMRLRPASLVGLDISRAMVGICRRNLIHGGGYAYVDLVMADGHRMPLRDGSVDMVVSTGTLHHIRRPAELFSECLRVLRTGGEAWIYEFSHDGECGGSPVDLGRSCLLMRFLASLHGLPRRVFLGGYIREALSEVGCRFSLEFRGLITKLVLRK